MISNSEFGLTSTDIQRIKNTLASFPEVQEAILYGSRALGTHKNHSDIDLTLTGPDLTLTKLLQVEIALENLLLPYKFDLSIKSKIENSSLVDHIDRVGIVFYKSHNLED